MTQPASKDSSAHAVPPCDSLDPRPEDIVAFPDGIPGFESCRRFVLMKSDDTAPLERLQALDSPQPAFLTIDPSLVLPGFRRLLNPHDRMRLDAGEGDVLLWRAIVTLDGDGQAASVNLRAPVVINPRLMIGFQVMPHQSLYPIRHPLSL